MFRVTHSVPPSYWRYQARLWHFVFQDFKWVIDLIIATAIAAFTAWVQVHWGLIPANQKELFGFSIAAPYIVVFLIHILWKRLVAPWKLDAERDREISGLNTTIKEKDQKIADLEWPSDRPIIQFVEWGDNPKPNNFDQCGFFLMNMEGLA